MELEQHLTSSEACALANTEDQNLLQGLVLLYDLDLERLSNWAINHTAACVSCRWLVRKLSMDNQQQDNSILNDEETGKVMKRFLRWFRLQELFE